MIYLFIKSYLILFFLAIAGVMSVFIFGLYLIFKPRKKAKRPLQQIVLKPEKKLNQSGIHITSHDINAIAGDDIIATQLDLARAYIETGKAKLAKKILMYVIEKGSASQQQEARHLLGST